MSADKEKLAAAGAVNLGAGFAGKGLAFLFTLAMARGIGSHELGRFWMSVGLFSILSALAHAGFSMTAMRFISEHRARGESGGVKGALAFAVLGAAAVSGLMAWTLARWAGPAADFVYRDASLAGELAALAWALPAAAIGAVLLNACLALEDFRANAIVLGIADPGGKLALFGLLSMAGFGARAPYLAFALSAILSFLIVAWRLWRCLPAGFARAQTLWNPVDHARYAIVMQWGHLFATSLEWADAVMLGRFLEPQAVAYYGVAQRLANFAGFSHAAVSPFLAPMLGAALAREDRAGARDLLRAQSRWETALMLPILVGLIVFGKPILSVFGFGFESAYPALALILIGSLLNASVGSIGDLLNMSRHYAWGLVNVSAQLSGFLGAASFLIPRYGLVGAGLCHVISLALVRGLCLAEVQSIFKIHPFDRWTLALAAGALVSVAIHAMLPGAPLFSLAPLLIFAGWIWKIGIPEEDRKLLSLLRLATPLWSKSR